MNHIVRLPFTIVGYVGGFMKCLTQLFSCIWNVCMFSILRSRIHVYRFNFQKVKNVFCIAISLLFRWFSLGLEEIVHIFRNNCLLPKKNFILYKFKRYQ